MSDTAPINIPAWFAKGDVPSPCLCGQPLQPGEPYLIAEAEDGGKRWFHLMCFQMLSDFGNEDDYDD
jgi:hypothetical protein